MSSAPANGPPQSRNVLQSPSDRGPPRDGSGNPPQRQPGPPAPPGAVPAGPPSGPPGGQVNPKPDPKADPKYQQRCFKTADETTICVVDTNEHYNTTDVFDQSGVYDRKNNYGHSDKHNVAGSVRGQNMTETINSGKAPVGQRGPPGPQGDTKFDSYSFEEDGGFQDTHKEDASPRNGNTFTFEDHKEDFDRGGKDSRVHSSKPDGERTDAEGHSRHESNSGADVKDKNGVHDDIRKNTNAEEYRNLYQKHHAGPDNSDAQDSKVTHGGWVNSNQLKDEHTDANIYTLHEEDFGKGAWSFSLSGNNALEDLFKDSQNWRPKGGNWGQNSKDWFKNIPRDETHVEVEFRATAPEDLEKRGREQQNPDFSRPQGTSSRRRRCKYRGCRPHTLDLNPSSTSHEQGGIEPRGIDPHEPETILDVLADPFTTLAELRSQHIPRSALVTTLAAVGATGGSSHETSDDDGKPSDGFCIGMFFLAIGVVSLLVVGMMKFNGRKMKKSLQKAKEHREQKSGQESEPTV